MKVRFGFVFVCCSGFALVQECVIYDTWFQMLDPSRPSIERGHHSYWDPLATEQELNLHEEDGGAINAADASTCKEPIP